MLKYSDAQLCDASSEFDGSTATGNARTKAGGDEGYGVRHGWQAGQNDPPLSSMPRIRRERMAWLVATDRSDANGATALRRSVPVAHKSIGPPGWTKVACFPSPGMAGNRWQLFLSRKLANVNIESIGITYLKKTYQGEGIFLRGAAGPDG